MTRVIMITFGFLGWAWFEMSGGSEFEPGETGVSLLARFEAPVEAPVDAPQTIASVETEAVVTRADTSAAPLTRISQPRIIVKPAPQFQDDAQIQTVAAPGESTLILSGLGGEASKLGQPIGADPVANAISAAVDYRVVTGSRVNLRSGPSTEFAVVTRLVRGNEVEVLQDDGFGWVKLRALNGDDIGWMSASFLAAAE